MHVDYLTLACLRDDLDTFLGARVQQVVFPDEWSIELELYAGRRAYLLLSAHPQYARMLFVPQKLRRGLETETPLLLLLRKWVRGARLVDVRQPDWERVLELHFEGEAGVCTLIAEIMGRYSNIVLVNAEGRVLDALKRIGPDLNRYRVTLPGKLYAPPPPPADKCPPLDLTPDTLARLLANAPADEPVARLLPRWLLGVSPTAAREAVYRASGTTDATPPDINPHALLTALGELYRLPETGDWAPHVALDETGTVVAFAPYELRHYDHREAVEDISMAMWRYFSARLDTDPYAAARRQVRERIEEALARVERSLDQLRENLVPEQEITRLREAGELLLAYQWQVPRGAREVTLPDYEGQPRTITLDPAKTPVENAQTYFERYEKLRRAAEEVPKRIAAFETERDFLHQLLADLELAEDRSEIDAVRDALIEAGFDTTTRRRKGAPVGRPLRFEVDGFPVYVGRNARQNDEVTFKRASPDDLWFHVRGMPGAHVILKNAGRPVPPHVLERVASLAAWYSPARKGGGEVLVDYTERRYVRRVPGKHPGLVTYRNEQTIWAQPRPPEEVADM